MAALCLLTELLHVLVKSRFVQLAVKRMARTLDDFGRRNQQFILRWFASAQRHALLTEAAAIDSILLGLFLTGGR